MASHQSKPARTRNRLLAALPEGEYDRVLARFETVYLTTKHLVTVEDRPVEHAYFPLNCVISLVAWTDADNFAEVATVGREGMVGTSLLLGTETAPHRSFAQIPGESLRIHAEAFRDEITHNGPFVAILNRYMQMLMVQVAQGAACNSRHSVEQRCAKWLLMSHDRVDSDEFPLTQEFLCQMLGVRRATVSEIASRLQDRGLIQYARGNVTIRDTQGLEGVACNCYHIVRDEYNQLLVPPKSRRA